jgi:hypothetical protein
MSALSRFCVAYILLLILPAIAAGQISREVAEKMDATVASAYQVAAAKLPCKVSAARKTHMLDWKEVDKCMEQARQRLDWDQFSSRLKELRPSNVSEGDFAAAVENSLARQALPYNKVFLVKGAEALLPLTNSILKYVPQNSLMDQPVFVPRVKYSIGVFAGVFFYERSGALASGISYRLALFQYTDSQGKIQTSSDKLLLDSYGVPWAKIESQPGFRFPISMLPGIGRK